jgi:hypothetical protein
MCCGCHTHKAQRGFTRAALDAWRENHALLPATDAEWAKHEQQARRTTPPLLAEIDAAAPDR